MPISKLRLCSLTLCLLARTMVFSQDVQAILNKSVAKCRSIRNGSYELILQEKFLSEKDTVLVSTTTCSFVKHPEDSVFGSFFHAKTFQDQRETGEYIYSGKEFIDADVTAATATFFSIDKHTREILDLKHNYSFYTLFTDVEHSPLTYAEGESARDYTYRYNGVENVNHVPCYHIQLNEQLIPGEGDVQSLRAEYHFWIDRKRYLPIQYSISNDVVLFSDTLYQYEKYLLKSYKLNQLGRRFSVMNDFDTGAYVCKEYAPDSLIPLLSVGSKAPDWKLRSISGIEYSLHDLEGKWVLIDFFFKSCYPCIKAFPVLHDLQENYASNGLIVIGMDTQDQNDDQFQEFLSKHQVNYPIILEAAKTVGDYRVTAYPTIYLIDKSGYISYAGSGFSKDMGQELEQLLKGQ